MTPRDRTIKIIAAVLSVIGVSLLSLGCYLILGIGSAVLVFGVFFISVAVSMARLDNEEEVEGD